MLHFYQSSTLVRIHFDSSKTDFLSWAHTPWSLENISNLEDYYKEMSAHKLISITGHLSGDNGCSPWFYFIFLRKYIFKIPSELCKTILASEIFKQNFWQ